MARGNSGTSISPGPSASTPKDRRALAAALYGWCQRNFREDQIIYQDELMKSGIIPGNDKATLLAITQTLLNDRLFTSREFSSGPLGWLMTSQASAEKYKKLSSDEGLVYRVIESAGRAGAWVKTIKSKLNLHQKNVDSSIKALLQRAYIKSMATVKYPHRKMYILASLQPNEDATGGAWFTDGALDRDILEKISAALEWKTSAATWKLVTIASDHSGEFQTSPHRKRKEPDTGFSPRENAKEKTHRSEADLLRDGSTARRLDGGDLSYSAPAAHESIETRPLHQRYVPHLVTHPDYPTLKDLTVYIGETNLMSYGGLTESNISQLLDVMTYDDRIIKITSVDGSLPDRYKARKNPAQISAERALESRITSAQEKNVQDKKALRELEIKTLGAGGITEIPCGRCPVFDMCDMGGPVNPDNCQYFDEWLQQVASSRGEATGLTW